MSLAGTDVLFIHGHVILGTSCDDIAVFMLKLFGCNVSAIVTGQLSNANFDFEKVKGIMKKIKELGNTDTSADTDNDDVTTVVTNRIQADDMDRIYKSLKRSGQKYDVIITGHAGRSLACKKKWGEIVKDIKLNNSDCLHICDPILGDDGFMFEEPETVDVFREDILPLADIATPNGFELDCFLGREIQNEQDALEGIAVLHNLGVKIVFVTSVFIGVEGKLASYASVHNEETCLKIEFEKFPGIFPGSGDLTIAVFGCWYMEHRDVKVAFERTISTMHTILRRTYQAQLEAKQAGLSSGFSGLKIYDDIEILRDPTILFQSERIQKKRQ